MRRALASDHQAAVARRLELLSAELATVRGEPRDLSPRARLQLAAVGPELTGEQAEPDDGLGADAWVPGGPTRVRPDPWAPADLAAPGPVVPRAPGRHASRRVPVLPRGSGLLDPLRGRWGLGLGHVLVVSLAAVTGLVLTCWWLVRSGGHEVSVPVSLPASDAPAALATPVGQGPAPAGGSRGPSVDTEPGGHPRIVVDVTGKVRHPGIVILRPGSRVVDAVRAAGGARPGATLGSLNLARVLNDGEQIVVGTPVAPGATPVAGTSPSGSPVVGLVDLNTADQTALESLPEVGPVTAQAILAWRTEHGGFTAVSQLLDVDGIGEATLAKITPYVTV